MSVSAVQKLGNSEELLFSREEDTGYDENRNCQG